MRASTQHKIGIVLAMLMGCATVGQAQGTVTFDQWPEYSFSQTYSESGVLFTVLSTNGIAPQSYMAQMPGGNPPPDMIFVQDHGTNSGYVSISLLSGQPFGLVSLDIGHIISNTNLEFVGHLTDGSTISATYFFPHLSVIESYSLPSSFSQGLTSVDLFSQGFALDNIVVTVPEPRTECLLILSLLASAIFLRGSRKGSNIEIGHKTF